MLALFLTQPTPPVRMAWRASSARIADWESDLTQSTDPVVLQTLRTDIEAARRAMAKGARLTEYLPTSVGEVTPDLDSHYSHPIVLLVDATCFSGCEVFAAMMQDLHLAKVAGERTGGAGGATNIAGVLPYSGAKVQVTQSLIQRLNGRPYENFGIQPNVHLAVNAADVGNGYADFQRAYTRLIEDLIRGTRASTDVLGSW